MVHHAGTDRGPGIFFSGNESPEVSIVALSTLTLEPFSRGRGTLSCARFALVNPHEFSRNKSKKVNAK